MIENEKMALPEHIKIINKVARQIFKPHGMVRKGQSRTWYDDHGWFTIYVEFPPHRWDKGTFVNVNVNFHWYEKDYISFDLSHNGDRFLEFVSAEQFTPKVTILINNALNQVFKYREELNELASAKQIITEYTFHSDNLWGNYHKGVICGLNNEMQQAIKYFELILEQDDSASFVKTLKDRTKELLDLKNSPEAFINHVIEVIKRKRNLIKLEDLEIEMK